MLKEMEPYAGLPEQAKQAVLALSVVMERIRSLPKADRDDLYELVGAIREETDDETRRGIQRAMEEILAQIPIRTKPMPFPTADKALSRGLDAWAKHVGQTIRQLRERAGLSQTELAEKAGLTQSHVSRIENAAHSATHLTLEKVAKALHVDVGVVDPCVD
ncbi:MAG: helix-turn-helix domain-containing protein [Planctomycetia bacterium]